MKLDLHPGFGHFMRTAGHHRLLSAREEADLGRRVAAGTEARSLLDRGVVDADGRLSEVISMGEQARSRLIRHNVRLVVDYVRKYLPILSKRTLEFEDLVQEGMFGLMRAADKFDPTRGYRFSTYATWWVRQSVERGIANRGYIIRVPVHAQDQIRRLRKLRTRFEEAGVPVTAKKLAKVSGISVAEIEGLLAVESRMHTRGLEEGIGGSTLRRVEHIGDDGAQHELDAVERGEVRDTIMRTMKERLTEREREVLVLRFGLDGSDRQATLEELGQRSGLTRERIRQIQNGALERMAGASYLEALL